MAAPDAQFQIRFDGPALDNHTMNVKDLAPALLSVSNLLDEAGKVLYGPAFEVDVHVTSVGDGCFMTELAVLWNQTVDMLNSDTSTAISQLLGYLGIAGSTASLGYFSVIKLLQKYQGRPPTMVEENEETGTARVQFEDGDVYEVPNDVMRLFRDIATRTALDEVTQPLERPGIDSVSFKSNEPDSEPTVIEKSDRASFERPVLQEQEILRDRREQAFTVVSVAFQGDNKWRLNDGNTTIYAAIRDEAFLKRVETNQERFGKGDILICQIEVVQSRGPNGLSIENTVLEVTEHIEPPRQINIGFDGAQEEKRD